MIIYKVTNLVNGKIYIGQTSRDFEIRKKEHIYGAKSNNTEIIFHKAIRKYGEDNFKWEIIDNVELENELSEKERYYISLYHSFINDENSNGYNMTIGGEGAIGLKFSDERNKKISESQMGSNNTSAKLSEEDVLLIKELIKQGLTPSEIAPKYNIDHATVSAIKTGKIWSHIGEDLSYIEYSKIKYSKLDEDDIKEIKLLIKDGKLSQTKIGNKFNVGIVTINSIKTGKRWQDIGEDISDIKYKVKLTDEKVMDIKILLNEGELSIREIADIFEVSKSMIFRIKEGKSWSHVGNDIFINEPSKPFTPKLSEKDVKEIKVLLKESSLSQKEIGNIFNVKQITISKIKTGKTWKHIGI